MSNPITSPDLYNFYTLNGTRTPGVVEITSGGERDLNWTKQQGVFTVGASTILRYEEIAEVTFRHKLWTPADFVAFDAQVTMLNAGVDTRPPKAWTLGCERLKHCRISAVSLRKVAPLLGVRSGPFTQDLTYIAYKKPKPFGGPLVKDDPGRAKELADKTDEAKQLAKDIAAHYTQRAARAGK